MQISSLSAVPSEKIQITDIERAKRMRALGREAGVDNDPASFDRAFDRVVPRPHRNAPSKSRNPPVAAACTRGCELR
jgi:hypothetical protein